MLSIFRRRSQAVDHSKTRIDILSTTGRQMFYGVNAYDNTPLTLDLGDSIHTALVGPTGSGKSSMTALLIEQGIIQGRSFLVIDMKGLDHMFLGTMNEVAARLGIDPPIHLTTTFGKSTHLVPFMKSETWMHGLSPQAKADALTASLSISDPKSHSWWSDAVEALYLYILENSDPTEIDDFVKFCKMIERRRGDLPKSLREASLHGLLKMERLARVAMFNPPHDCPPAAIEHALHFERFYQSGKPLLVYVALDSLRMPKTSEAVVGLLCRHLLNTGAQLGNQRERGIEVVIDETQRAICGNSFLDEMLTLSRSAGISFTAAFQDLEALKHRGVDYASKFEENCHVHLTFGAHSVDSVKRLVALSGEYERVTRSVTFSYPGLIKWRSWSETFRREAESRFNCNDVMAVSADPERFIFRALRNSNLCALNGLPVVARVVRHISKQQYEARCNTDWPEPTDRTVVCGTQHHVLEAVPTNTPVPPTGIPSTSEQPKVLRPSRRR